MLHIARSVDVSAVRTDVTMEELKSVIQACKRYRFVCAFAMPCYTELLIKGLAGEPDIAVGGVVGFPSGADTTSIKVQTAREMLALGCEELDMVVNVGALKSGLRQWVVDDIRAVVDEAGEVPVKSILETACLTDDEIALGAELAVSAGVRFVKTGTGWANKPTKVETIRLIKKTIGDSALIKAAGGVHTLDTILAMMDAGCSRFGVSLRSIWTIMREVDARLGRLDNFELEAAVGDDY